jgi:hypothetical protein
VGRRVKVGALGLVLALVAGACGDDGDAGDGASGTGSGAPTAGEDGGPGAATIRVPEDQPTIQAAVDAAAPGDLVLVGPGVYREAVDVTTDLVTIRGLDRNEVILDGGFELDNGIRVLGARGVAVENMTARNYVYNGFLWTGVDGYRGSYLTAYRNGDYGVYVFDSVNGLIEHSYASGSPDAGFYIGQCYPCNAVIDRVVSEWNGLGYSGTNSGGDLYVVRSVFRDNRTGVVPNSGSYELCYPQRETVVAGNLVVDNDNQDTPAIDAARLGRSNGVLVAGGTGNVIVRNLVVGHDRTGIALTPFPEENPVDTVPDDPGPCADTKDDPPPDPDGLPPLLLWEAKGNVVRGNVVRDSGLADLAFWSSTGEVLGNCFAGNDFTSSAPSSIEAALPCEGAATADPTAGLLDFPALVVEEAPPSGDYRTTPEPELSFETMPDAATAPARPATDVPPAVDLDAIRVPGAPAGAGGG